MIRGGELIAIGACFRFMLLLCRYRRNVALVRKFLLLSCRPRSDSTFAAVKAHMADVADHRLLIHVVDDVHVHVVHAAVVEKMPTCPITACVSVADIAKAVVDSTVEADLRSPVAGVPHVGASFHPQ